MIVFTPLLLANETEIDYCRSCKGVWFDGKELERVHSEERILHAILDTTTLHPSPLRCKKCGSLNPRSAATCSICRNELRLFCPRCNQALKEIFVGKLQADRCEKCRGVWLDGGELDELFAEFQKVTALQKGDAAATKGETMQALGEVTLNTLIWAPELVYYSAAVFGQVASKLPGAALEVASNMPEIAGKVAEASGEVITGAIDLAARVPEAAGSIAELLSSFLEALLGLFD